MTLDKRQKAGLEALCKLHSRLPPILYAGLPVRLREAVQPLPRAATMQDLTRRSRMGCERIGVIDRQRAGGIGEQPTQLAMYEWTMVLHVADPILL